MIRDITKNTFLFYLVFFTAVVVFSGCSKDTGETQLPAPTDRIKTALRQTQRPGITIQPVLYTFAYQPNSNQLQRITLSTVGLTPLGAFVYDYHPDGRPKEIKEFGADLTTLRRTIDFMYNGTQLVAIGDINFLISNNKVSEIGNARLIYNEDSNVMRTFSNNPLTPNVQLTRNNFTTIRNPLSAMFDRLEVALSLLHILQPIPATEVVNRFFMSSSDLLNTSGGSVGKLTFSVTNYPNGFAMDYIRTSTIDDDRVSFSFEYEPRQ